MTSGSLRARAETGFAETEEGEKQLNEARGQGDIVKCLVVRCYATTVVFGPVVPRNGVYDDDFVAGTFAADVA